MSELELNFNDTAIAFSDKSNAELKKKYQLFKLINSPFLTGIGTELTEFAFRLHLPIKSLVKHTIFAQFCGGETIEECQPTIEKLGASRIGTILDYSVEGKSAEAVFESTKNEIIRTITRAKEDANVPVCRL
jgi:proline dehydrogenase